MKLKSSALLAICFLAPALAGVEEDAARAFVAGDHDRALELYREVLEEQPRNETALLRAGKIHSWQKRFDEALRLYDRLLTVNPDHGVAAAERAKVLSWAGRYDEAFAAFDEYLDRHPDDTDAMVALGRAHAWSGDLRSARGWYGRVLADEPGHVDAKIGLSYVELWSGDAVRAHRMARELAEAHPELPDVVELRRRTARARGPWLRAEASRLDDTDDNKLDVYGLRGGAGVGGVDLSLGVTRYEMRDPTGNARIDNVSAEAAFRPGRGQRLTLVAGYDDREPTTGDDDGDVLGGLHWRYGLDRAWRFRFSAQRHAIRYNPTITDNGILIDDLAIGVDGRIGSRWSVHAGAAQGDYSDDNDRFQATAGFSHELTRRRTLRLSTGLGLRFTDFDADTDGGYFDPQDFTSALAHLRGHGEIGTRQRYRFSLDAGVQSFTLGGVDTDGDFVVIASAGWVFPLGRGLELELFGEWGDYAGLSAAGFESRQAGLRLAWRPGGGR